MKDRSNPFIQAGFAEYAGIHMMPFGWRERAATHEVNRQHVVAKILLDIYLMAFHGIISKGVNVNSRGAQSQTLKGNRVAGTQAAHCPPRQIFINNQPVQSILQPIFPERAWILAVLFGETDILPANFNKADSRAERFGLAVAFQEACRSIIFKGHFGGNDDLDSVLLAVSSAYSIYEKMANTAFGMCEVRLLEKLKDPIASHQDQVGWNEQLHITRQYAETLLTAEGKIKAMSPPPKVEGVIKIYRDFGH